MKAETTVVEVTPAREEIKMVPTMSKVPVTYGSRVVLTLDERETYLLENLVNVVAHAFTFSKGTTKYWNKRGICTLEVTNFAQRLFYTLPPREALKNARIAAAYGGTKHAKL